ncbi:MAG: hypothetical protein K6F49_08460 [Saccharofermentans sp.]|nr:hypothetical protein [Saccharofermentans sp.]
MPQKVSRPDHIHLYIEKYNSRREEILFDFVNEKEYQAFLEAMDISFHTNNEEITYRPTMILANDCSPKRAREGIVISIELGLFFQVVNTVDNSTASRRNERSCTVVWNIVNGKALEEIIDNEALCDIIYWNSAELYGFDFLQDSFIHNYWDEIQNEDQQLILSEELGRIKDDPYESRRQLIVWDVGQGNSNCIVSDHTALIYDMGASSYYTTNRIIQLIDHITPPLRNKYTSLVISHWDIDHYIQLCHVSDDFLKSLQCIIFPAKAFGLTAQQVLNRIAKNCKNIIAIFPPKIRGKNAILHIGYIGNTKLFIGKNYASKNRSGILLYCEGHLEHALLTGDHTEWNPTLANQICAKYRPLNIVIPHHGALSCNPSNPNITSKDSAVLSVGSNSYGHPFSQTIKDYSHEHYHLRRTDREGDIYIDI